MYIYGGEGYLISARLRARCPGYVRERTRPGKLGYPFVLNRIEVPKEYGGFIPGAPGTIDAVPHWSTTELDNTPLLKSFLSEKVVDDDEGPIDPDPSVSLDTLADGDRVRDMEYDQRFSKPNPSIANATEVRSLRATETRSRDTPSSGNASTQQRVAAPIAPRPQYPVVNNTPVGLGAIVPIIPQPPVLTSARKSAVNRVILPRPPVVTAIPLRLRYPNGSNTPVDFCETRPSAERLPSARKSAVNRVILPRPPIVTPIPARLRLPSSSLSNTPADGCEITPRAEKPAVARKSAIVEETPSLEELTTNTGTEADNIETQIEKLDVIDNGAVNDGTETVSVAEEQNSEHSSVRNEAALADTNSERAKSSSEIEPSAVAEITTRHEMANDGRKQPRVGTKSRRKTALPPLKKPKVIKTAPTMGTRLKKRTYYADPKGMENEHTVHFRNVMFGEEAYRKEAGKGSMGVVNEHAARARLFHTVTNIPLDVETYNAGYDSDLEDGGAEVRWRVKLGDERLGEVVDMLAIEKYFFSLWNQFKMERYFVANDRDVYPACMAFVNQYGAEIKRMKMEAVLVVQLVRLWKFGCLDANGFMSVLRAFGDFDMSELVKGVPDASFEMAHQLLREVQRPYMKRQKYAGMDGVKGKVKGAGMRWVRQERERLEEMGGGDSWWMKDPMQWIGNLVEEEGTKNTDGAQPCAETGCAPKFGQSI